jgi:hypothetical protein
MYKKVAFIAAAVPPKGGSHAQRIVALSKFLWSKGIDVDLFVPSASNEDKAASKLYDELTKYVNIIEVGQGAIRGTIGKIRKVEKAGSLFSGAIQKLRAFVRQNSLPDTYIGWALNVRKKIINRNKLENYDLLISSGAPFSCHISAYLVANNLKIPLMLDYGDPWVYEPGRKRRGLRLFIEKKLESIILKKAIYISVTTKETVDLYERKFPESIGKVKAHYMGFDAQEFMGTPFQNKHGQIEVAYAGRINEEYRDLKEFVEFLKFVDSSTYCDKFKAHFYGNELINVSEKLSDYVAKGLVQFHGSLEHSLYIDRICSVDGLLVFGNNSLIQIPGKIAHFIASRRPMLYFSNGINFDVDPSLNLLREVNEEGVFLGGKFKEYDDFLSWCSDNKLAKYRACETTKLEWNNVFDGFGFIH